MHLSALTPQRLGIRREAGKYSDPRIKIKQEACLHRPAPKDYSGEPHRLFIPAQATCLILAIYSVSFDVLILARALLIISQCLPQLLFDLLNQ